MIDTPRFYGTKNQKWSFAFLLYIYCNIMYSAPMRIWYIHNDYVSYGCKNNKNSFKNEFEMNGSHVSAVKKW